MMNNKQNNNNNDNNYVMPSISNCKLPIVTAPKVIKPEKTTNQLSSNNSTDDDVEPMDIDYEQQQEEEAVRKTFKFS